MIRYALDGKDPGESAAIYDKPFTIRESAILTAVAKRKGLPESFRIQAWFTRIPKDRKITLNTKYAPQYSA